MDLQSKSADNVQILTLSGRFDALTAPLVQEWIEQTLSPEHCQIVIDLKAVSFVDSTALATLVSGMKRARQLEGDLCLCGLQPPVRMVFELTRLDQAFEIFLNEEDAVRALTS